MKKNIFLLLIVIIAIAYYYFSTGSNNKINPYSAIPKRTAAFFKTNDLNSLSDSIINLSYYKKIKELTVFETLQKQISVLDTFPNFEYIDAYVSILNTGSSKMDFLLVFDTKSLLSKKKLNEKLNEKGFKLNDYNYQKYKITTATINSKKITFSIFNNLLILSHNAPLVEESLNYLNDKNHFVNSEEFQRLENNQDSSFLNLYINYKSKDLHSLLFKSQFLDLNTNVKNVAWTNTSVFFNKNGIDLKTFYSFDLEDNSIIENFSRSEAVSLSAGHVLPNNTAYFEASLSKNNASFSSNDISYQFFRKWLDQEAVYFCLETFDENFLKKSGFLLKAKNIDTAKVNLYLLNQEMKPIETFEGQAIYKMNVSVLSNFFKSKIFQFDKPFFMFLGSYVVFSEDVSVLKTCYHKYISNKTLEKDAFFKNVLAEGNLPSKIVYLNPQKWHLTLNSFFQDKIFPFNIGKSSFKTYVTDSLVYTKGLINFKEEKINKTSKIWEVVLDAPSSFNPQIVVNADNRRKEILTQDDNNIVYLIDQSGYIIFKKQIKEKIQGEVYQIDFYKSNKLQYVFNTKNYIYLLDRKGRLIDGFPLKLPAEASNSIYVVNYDKAKIYRYFIACKNGKVYGYDVEGKPLDSWSPLGKFNKITLPFSRNIIENKDYLYTNTSKGTFYAYSRKGEERFSPIGLGSNFRQIFEKTKKGFINLGNGSIYKIDEKGKTSVKIVADSSYTIFANYKEKEAFAIANLNTFKVVKSKWTILGSKKLNDEIISIKKISIQKNIWFLIQCKKSIYLINEYGEIHPDFPMLSSSKARIVSFYNKKETLIFHHKNKLNAFELVLPD